MSPEPETTKKMDKKDDLTLTRAGGAYIPPAKLKLLMEKQGDKSSEQYQRMNWDRLKKKIHGQVNKVNITNIVQVVRELLQENVIRGKGLLSNSIIQAQAFSPSFSHVYSALVSIINSKFPNIGELILRRLTIQFKRAFRTNNKGTCVTVATFIGHLANQRVCHELLILQILLLLMENPTDDSIEIAVSVLKVCGQMLTQVAPQGLYAIFEQLRRILEECDEITSRTQYMIEVLFAVRKEKFAAYPAVLEELDLIDEEDQVCHIVNLVSDDGKPLDPELGLNIFKLDPTFEENEAKYDEIRREIIGDADDSDDDDEEEKEGEGNEENEEAVEKPEAEKPLGTLKIIDMTENEKAAFRRNVYLTIKSSLDFQEAAHKLIKNMLKPGVEDELCNMIVDCCAQERSYTPFFGKLAERFCKLRKEFQDSFEAISKDSYVVVHRFDMTKLRNLAMLVSHLLATDAISWEIFKVVKITEDDTTSAGRIFIKIVFTQLCEHLGLIKLDERLHDPTLYHAFEGLFPRDHPKNTRFAINFFSFIGLSGLTLDLRKHLKKKEKKMKMEPAVEEESSSSSSSDSSSDSSSEDSSSSDDSESSSTSSPSDEEDVKPSAKVIEEIKRKAKISDRDERRRRKDSGDDKDSKRRRSRSPQIERRRKSRTPEKRKRKSSETDSEVERSRLKERESRRRGSPDKREKRRLLEESSKKSPEKQPTRSRERERRHHSRERKEETGEKRKRTPERRKSPERRRKSRTPEERPRRTSEERTTRRPRESDAVRERSKPEEPKTQRSKTPEKRQSRRSLEGRSKKTSNAREEGSKTPERETRMRRSPDKRREERTREKRSRTPEASSSQENGRRRRGSPEKREKKARKTPERSPSPERRPRRRSAEKRTRRSRSVEHGSGRSRSPEPKRNRRD